MSVFLVVMMGWEMAYRGYQLTPLPPQPMPNIEACEKVGAAMQTMNKNVFFRCVQTP